MNKVKGFIVSLEKFDEIAISENFEELIKKNEPKANLKYGLNSIVLFHRQ